jgi:hypothetical protein
MNVEMCEMCRPDTHALQVRKLGHYVYYFPKFEKRRLEMMKSSMVRLMSFLLLFMLLAVLPGAPYDAYAGETITKLDDKPIIIKPTDIQQISLETLQFNCLQDLRKESWVAPIAEVRKGMVNRLEMQLPAENLGFDPGIGPVQPGPGKISYAFFDT